MQTTAAALALALASSASLAQTPQPPASPPPTSARPASPPAASPAPSAPPSPGAATPGARKEPPPSKAPIPRGAVLEEVSGVVQDVDRKTHQLTVDSGSGQVKLSLDRNTMVYTANGLGTVLDLAAGQQVRAGRNADFLAYWVQVRVPAKTSPVSTPGQGTGPGGGGAAPAGESSGPGAGPTPSPPTSAPGAVPPGAAGAQPGGR
jgi:glucose/arabinose dehydrogenase